MKTPLKLLLAALGIAIVVACSSGGAEGSQTTCEPGAEIYCRCENLDEGSQLCKDDGSGYERCEPCFDDYDQDGDYGFPEDDGSPGRRDAGPDAESGCGNGVVDEGESCDDGNGVEGDGCDACVAGGNPLGGSVCPGVTVHLWTEPFQLRGSSQDASTAHTGIECNGVTGESSPDRVYGIVPHATGTLRITVESAAFETALYARTRCDDVGSQTACSLEDTLDLEVTANEPVYLTVDGNGPSQRGAFELRLALVPGN